MIISTPPRGTKLRNWNDLDFARLKVNCSIFKNWKRTKVRRKNATWLIVCTLNWTCACGRSHPTSEFFNFILPTERNPSLSNEFGRCVLLRLSHWKSFIIISVSIACDMPTRVQFLKSLEFGQMVWMTQLETFQFASDCNYYYYRRTSHLNWAVEQNVECITRNIILNEKVDVCWPGHDIFLRFEQMYSIM